ncbi:MAG: restriction endonuclease, partial [Gemmatimonadota bacterium]
MHAHRPVHNNRSLFSDHYLAERLHEHDEWSEDVSEAFERAREIYDEKRDILDGLNEAQTEKELVQPILEDVLGFTYEVQKAVKLHGRLNRPDYVLFPDADAKAEAQRAEGDDAYYDRAVAVADAKYWGRPLDAKADDGDREELTNVNPSFQIVNYLVATGVPWGVLTNGRVWRLYYARARSRIDTYFEVDLARILDDGDEAAFRWFLMFFRAAAFAPDPETGESFLEAVHEGSTRYGVALENRLKGLIFDRIFPHLATGFLRDAHGEDADADEIDQAELDEIYHGTLRLLYRLLFLLHAEARGLLPVADRKGYYNYSLTRIKADVAERIDGGQTLSAVSTDLWNDLVGLFRIIDRGDAELNVPRYNGGLFDEASPDNAFLVEHAVADRWLVPALDLLARDEPDAGNGRRPFVDYKTLNVEQLGSIYEGLLEFRLRAGEDGLVLENDKGERKATGSYYTPHYIVEYIVEHTLGPVMDEREARFRELMEEIAPKRERLAAVRAKLDAGHDNERVITRWTNERIDLEMELGDRDGLEPEAFEAVLGVRVCDPAMGSGHFLVYAVDWLTERLIALLNDYPDNPVLRRLETIRREILDEMERAGIRIDPAR